MQLEGSTLSVQPMQPVAEVVDFIRTGKNFRNYRKKAMLHQREFLKRYSSSLNSDQKLVSTLSVAAILFPGKFSSPGSLFKRMRDRTHVSTTERLDDVYTPSLPVDGKYLDHFQPTILVDHGGEINPALQDDVLGQNEVRPVKLKLK